MCHSSRVVLGVRKKHKITQIKSHGLMHHQTDHVLSFRFRRRQRLNSFWAPSIQKINVPALKNEFDFVLYIAQWSENVYSTASREFTLIRRV